MIKNIESIFLIDGRVVSASLVLESISEPNSPISPAVHVHHTTPYSAVELTVPAQFCHSAIHSHSSTTWNAHLPTDEHVDVVDNAKDGGASHSSVHFSQGCSIEVTREAHNLISVVQFDASLFSSRPDRKSPSTIYYQKGRQEIIERLGGCCTTCGSKENLHIDHIAPAQGKNRGKGSLHRLLDWRKNISNLQLLCEPCHGYKTIQEGSTITRGTRAERCEICGKSKRIKPNKKGYYNCRKHDDSIAHSISHSAYHNAYYAKLTEENK